jgi:carbonic anhydrase/acetyltransferase-like protein (isoleucine patch superfamily)
MKRIAIILAIMGAVVLLALGMSRLMNQPRTQTQGTATAYPPHPAAGKPGMHIDPTAFVHPSVILEGNITIGPYSYIDAGTILTGDITIGHHSLIRCNVTIRGTNRIGNYTHIYDNVNIEGGRPAKPTGGSLAVVADQSIIGDHCWINHGAIMHGTQIADGGAVGLNTACDYNTRIGKGAILADGSATHVNMVIDDNCFAEGVPAVIKRRNLTEKDRADYFGVSPLAWTTFEGERQEASAKKRLGLQ